MRVLIYSLFTLSCFGASSGPVTAPRVLAFEARGHAYIAHGPGHSLSVTTGTTILTLGGQVFRMSLVGANPAAKLEALDRMPGKANYLLGRDVRASYDLFGRVRQRAVYPGIDLLFHGNQERLEYDFEIAAGRDPGRIRVNFQGADEIRIDPSGALILRAGMREIRQPAPVAYQLRAGRRTPVSVAYRLDAAHRVHFQLGAYDRTRALVIDPELVFDSFFGGVGGASAAADVALDAQGNIYAAGQTNSGNFPVQSAAQNHPGAAPLLASKDGGQTWTTPAIGGAALVRSIASAPATPNVLYAAAGTSVAKSVDGGTTWTVPLTPANGGMIAPPIAIAVDAGSSSTVYAATSNRSVFVSTNSGASWTVSTNGLITPGSVPPSPAQLSMIAASPTEPGVVFAIAFGPDFIYRSTDFGQTWTQLPLPVPGGSPAALAFSPSDPHTLFLGQQTGAFLTSTDSGNTWTALSAQTVFGPQGLAILPGDSPVLLAAGQNNLNRSTDGGRTWTAVLPLRFGSVAADPRNAGVAYAVDSSGLYRSSDAGQTWTKAALPYAVSPVSLFVSAADSRVFVGQGSQTDAFVTKWSPDGKQILYSTYLGGSGNDSATGLAVDSTGSVYVGGATGSPDFPVSKNAFQKTLPAPGRSAFVSKLSPDGAQLIYSTLLGGGAEVSTRIAINRAGEAVLVGSTTSPSFPVTPGAFQSVPVTPCSIQSPFVETSGTAFVSKVSADGGSLVYSTLLGGRCGTRAQTVAIDASGNAWVGGVTDSPDFPATKDALQPVLGGNLYDGFLASFSPSGALSYATYIGGPKYDTVTGVAFDPKGNIYLTGTSGGLSQPASPGAFNSTVTVNCVIFSIGPGVYQTTGSAFVLKLDSTAHTTLGLTYMGSPLCLDPATIAVDATGAPWIAGPLNPNGSAPQTAGPFQIGIGRGFVSKFSADFTQLLFSTYFDSVSGIAVDGKGLAYVAGVGAINNATSETQAYVAKIDPAPAAVSLDAVQNAVNPVSPSNTQGITAGELLRLFGKNLGPATATPGIVEGGVLSTSVAGVQVKFDGVPIPLLSVSSTEIDLVAPFELNGKTATTIQVVNNGVASNPVAVGIATGPVFLGVPSGRPLQVLGVYNPDFTVNSASNPAPAGSTMTLYMSGAGNSVPASQNGQINAAPLPGPPGTVQIALPGGDFLHPVLAPVTFAGAAAGLAAGIFQVNFVAPQESGTNLTLISGSDRATFNVWVR